MEGEAGAVAGAGLDGGRAQPGHATVAELNADVKGVAADPSYALEAAIRELAAARGRRTD